MRYAPFILLMGLVLHAFYYYPYFVDDGYISLRYAQRLAEGLGLTWKDGEHVEGYSNLLWVLLTAGLGRIGFDLVGAARTLGLTCALAVSIIFFRHARRAQLQPAALLIGLAVYAGTPAVAVWAMGGLETPLVMLLLGLAAMWCYPLLRADSKKCSLYAGMALGLLCLTRAEGPVYTIAIAAALLLHARPPWRARLYAAGRIAAVAVLFFFAQLLFRIFYYHQLLPNTVVAKVAFSHAHLMDGVAYVANGALSFLPLLCYILFSRMQMRRHPACAASAHYLSFLLTAMGLVTLAVAAAGGDIFPGFRALAPLVPLLALAMMESAAFGLSQPHRRRELWFIAYILLCHVWLQFSMNMNRLPKYLLWEQDAREIGMVLRSRYGNENPLIAVYAAGAVSYYSQLPSLDVYGLNDAQITRQRHAESRFGNGIPGHELFDGRTIDGRKPDILVFEVPGIIPLCDMPGYRAQCDLLLPHYRPATIRIPRQDVRIWIRKDSQKIKILP